jgi:nitrogen fixation/metabolism regulation signal transduction histidine kinase
MRRIFSSLELEWKIVLIAAVLFVAFLWPVQRYYMGRMQTLLEQSVDHGLDTLLRNQVEKADTAQQQAILTSLERHRQWEAMIPVIMEEQRGSIVWFSLGLFGLFLCLAIYILGRLTRPIKRLSAAADVIGKGKTADIRISSGGSLRRLEASMAQMQQELAAFREHAQAEGMEMAWRDIARVMAHEIKNPLTPIRLTLDRMQEKVESGEAMDTPELRKYLDRITLQIEHLEGLVNDFRSFAREPEVRLEQRAIRPLIEGLAQDMKPSIETEVEGDASLAIDPRLFNQVLLNLWKNAAEAGAKTVRVKIRTDADGTTVSIRDDGPGIPKERIERVWIPYVTYKKGGTGLGLPVVKRLVESMKGTVSLTSSREDKTHGVTVEIKFRDSDKKETVGI